MRSNQTMIPPGWAGDPNKYNQARGPLLGNQLGGSEDIPENLVTLQQNSVNSPTMRGYESQVRRIIERGETVQYGATPVYKGNNPIPRGVAIIANGNQGYFLGVTILNPVGN